MGLVSVSILASAFAALLGLVVLWRAPRHPAHLTFGIGMGILAAETVIAWHAETRTLASDFTRWAYLRLAVAALLPVPWLIFGRCYSRGDAASALRGQLRGFLAVALVPFVLALIFPSAVVVPPDFPLLSTRLPRLGWVGIAIELALLLTAVGVLTNLEHTFRGSVGVMRWRIKYMVLGVAVLFGFRLYAASQALLYRAPEHLMGQAGPIAVLIACILICVALARGSVFDVDVYPSHSLVYGSLTVLLAGAYLLIVGVLSHLVTRFGGAGAFPVKAFLVLVGVVGLAVLLLSERLRQRLRQFVSRNLRRPSYDYRRVWSEFTTRTTSMLDESEFCRAVTSCVSETFQALSASLWLVDDSGDQLRMVSSTVLADETAEQIEQPRDEVRQALEAIALLREPTVLEPGTHPWANTLARLHPGVFPRGGRRVCQPLVAGGKLLGILVLGDRVSGLSFTTEDFDLLKCVGDQVASSLLGLQLSHRLLRAKEMEAFQTMSAFFVHDLKNTASSLSLTLQNLHQHFSNPAFREDALRSVGKSVQHLNDLITRLSRLRQELTVRPVPQDLGAVVEAALATLGSSPTIHIHKNLNPVPPVLIDAEQLEKVVVNLVLNAREAIGQQGDVHITTSTDGNWATLVVADNGCGMSPEFLQRSLFRPFKTTKKNGLGIGMFHSKMIIDAHRGRLEVESTPGQGSTFRVLLPVAPATL